MEEANIPTLFDRLEMQSRDLFNDTVVNENRKLFLSS